MIMVPANSQPKPKRSGALALKLALVPLVLLLVLGLMLARPPSSPRALASLNEPFAAQSLDGLPTLSHYPGEDGQSLAYRHYPVSDAKGSVVLLHGSSADSRSMHTLAQALQREGLQVDALDLRGHGDSGPRGHIADAGQLSRDLQAFIAHTRPPQPRVLAGFSAGGGLALRHAAHAPQGDFQGLVLLAPYIEYDAPSTRGDDSDNSDWTGISLPRIIALNLLNAAGLSRFNDLPVLRFALDCWGQQHLTPFYDFNLMQAMRTGPNWASDIAHLPMPVHILVGDADGFMQAGAYPAMFATAPQGARVTPLPTLGHAELLLSPSATSATVEAVRAMIQ